MPRYIKILFLSVVALACVGTAVRFVQHRHAAVSVTLPAGPGTALAPLLPDRSVSPCSPPSGYVYNVAAGTIQVCGGDGTYETTSGTVAPGPPGVTGATGTPGATGQTGATGAPGASGATLAQLASNVDPSGASLVGISDDGEVFPNPPNTVESALDAIGGVGVLLYVTYNSISHAAGSITITGISVLQNGSIAGNMCTATPCNLDIRVIGTGTSFGVNTNVTLTAAGAPVGTLLTDLGTGSVPAHTQEQVWQSDGSGNVSILITGTPSAYVYLEVRADASPLVFSILIQF